MAAAAAVHSQQSDESVVLRLVASGAVDDYKDTTAIRNKLAQLAGVGPEWVSVEVAPASVIMTFTIAVPPATTAEVVKVLLSSRLSTAATASVELGIYVVEQMLSIVVAAPPPHSPPSPHSPPPQPPPPPPQPPADAAGLSSEQTIGVVAGSIAGLFLCCLCVGVCVLWRFREPLEFTRVN